MSRHVDLSGRRFGRWTVLRLYEWRDGKYCRRPVWWCRCDCGTEGPIEGNNLKAGLSTQCIPCGWRDKTKLDVGARRGTRTMIRREPGNLPVWRCDCGAETNYNRPTGACRTCSPPASLKDAASPLAKKITINGETHGLRGWARKTGVSSWTIQSRILAGWDVEKACTTPAVPHVDSWRFRKDLRESA